MKYLSICSGIEAASAAWHGFGWTPVGFSEIEAFPSAVLAHRFPDVPNFGDMTKYKQWGIERGTVELLVGGTPCQAFSVAGLRRGLDDARGNLTLTFCELADHFDPEVIVWENVPGVLSSKDNAFGCFLAGLVGADEPITPGGKWECSGVVSGPKRTAAWRVLDAQYFGVAQRRRRVFVLAFRGAGNWRAAAALFPVGESLFGDTAPSREKGEEVAKCLTTGVGKRYDPETESLPVSSVALRGRDGGATAELGDNLAGCLRASGGGGDKPHVLAPVCITGSITHTLKAEGFDASEDGTGRGQPIVTATRDLAQCLTSNYGKQLDNSDTALGPNVAISGMAVRRLTPTECERLQGFPDGWTYVPYRGKPAADGPRYKALGNSMAVPVMRWLGKRIAFVLRAY